MFLVKIGALFNLLYCDCAFHIKGGPTRDLHAGAGIETEQLAAALGNLQRVQFIFVKHIWPVGNQNTMGGARHRVLGNTDPRREEARHKVAPISPGRNNDTAALDSVKSAKVRL